MTIDRPLQGRTALVTGVSRLQSIGTGICRQLAQDGANIFFTYWQAYDRTRLGDSDADEPAVLQQALEATGVQVARLELGLSVLEAPAQLIATVQAELGHLMILVNNATYSIADGFEVLNARILDATYAVNLRAAALLSVEFARSFTFLASDEAEWITGQIVHSESGFQRG
jgi:3-oxoacyl-[acyl-carrier protein] reductase